MATELTLTVVNYAHGGGEADSDQACGSWDYSGLQRTLRAVGWPDLLVLCEAERYGFTGGDGMYGAGEALREEQRRLGLQVRWYVPLDATLTQDRGPIAPVVYYDPTTVVVRQWFDGEDADSYERTRNLLRFYPADCDGNKNALWQLVPQHWPWNKPLGRILDAEDMTRYASPDQPRTIVCGDFNTCASGEDVTHWGNKAGYWNAVRHSAGWRGAPDEYEFSALDTLIGSWDAQRGVRVGPDGTIPGFVDTGERDENLRPTEACKGPRPASRYIRFLINQAGIGDFVAGSHTVHDFLDEQAWDTDHRAVSIRVRV